MAPLRIDAHHHLWRYSPNEFSWLDDTMRELRRDFLVEDLKSVMSTAHVSATVAVQSRQSVAETRFLLDCARESSAVRGVVGWVPLCSAALGGVLDEFADEKHLVGMREIAQGQPKGFLDDASFNRGIAKLTVRDLAYDVLIYEDQMEEAIRLVDRHPKQRFVLDHAAKPKIAIGDIKHWRAKLQELAQRENVWCKLSGLVTEADWQGWTPDGLRPYLDACVDAFGVRRVMAGSDWPVCLVATEYAQWWHVLETYLADFSVDEREHVMGESAAEFYRIETRE